MRTPWPPGSQRSIVPLTSRESKPATSSRPGKAIRAWKGTSRRTSRPSDAAAKSGTVYAVDLLGALVPARGVERARRRVALVLATGRGVVGLLAPRERSRRVHAEEPLLVVAGGGLGEEEELRHRDDVRGA